MDKICLVTGVRPQLIRLSRVIEKLDKYSKLTFVYTNQNYTPNLRDIFFEQLGLREPDIYFNMKGSLGEQLANLFVEIEKVFEGIRPNKVVILGDTNTDLCAIMAERMGIPVFHIESANRSYNREIPEEVNRRLIDSISSYNLFYTPLNRHTLLREGATPKKIFQCGNPTKEVLNYYMPKIDTSGILKKLGLRYRKYFLVDIHRTENTTPERLKGIIGGLNLIAKQYKLPIICSLHPRTVDKLKNIEYKLEPEVKFLDAMGFFDFVKLEKNVLVGLTDSGLCSEEYGLLQVPCVVVRNETERPEVVEAGGAILSGISSDKIFECTKRMVDLVGKKWAIPLGYEDINVSDKIVNYILSHHGGKNV